ncbi:MAG: ATP-binding domain-containing protein, partial [Oscillochloris sp.]|nr:ATP-binding domain-containing protein [Oscillochloris sp.]
YQIAGDEPFFRRREIADLLKYPELAAYDAALRAGQPLPPAQGEQLALAWRSVYNRPKRYLTRQLAQECADAALRQGRPLSQSLLSLGEKVSDRTAASLRDLSEILIWLGKAQLRLPAEQLLADLDERLGYQGYLAEHSGFPETGAGYAANVAAFIQYARGRGTLAELRAHLEHLAATREEVEPQGDVVDIRTIHRAKGLEWPVVLLPYCNAGHMPFSGADDIEEERRLLYVAVTRAREWLHLYAVAGNEMRLSPFLAAVGAEGLLKRAAQLQTLLAGDPATWLAGEALSVASFPREFGQERLIQIWWLVPARQREQVAGRVLALIDALQARGAAERLGVGASERQLWAPLVGSAPAKGAFVGLDDLCALSPVGGQKRGIDRAHEPREPPPPSYAIGDRVKHPHFGLGQVVAIERGLAGRRVEWYLTVNFVVRGRVKLLAGIAPITKA